MFNFFDPPAQATLVEAVQDGMKHFKRGWGVQVTPQGVILGSQNPEFDFPSDGGDGAEAYAARLAEMAGFLASHLATARPMINYGPAPKSPGHHHISLGLSEGYPDKETGKWVSITHTTEEVEGYLEWLKTAEGGGMVFDHEVKPIILAYGGWPVGDSIGTASEDGVVIMLRGDLSAEQVKTIGDCLAGGYPARAGLNQSRWYLEDGDGNITIFERPKDVIPGKE